MDPVTQGVFGAIFAQAPARKKQLAKAAVIGALAGMTPDLDILIRSTDDPLLALEYHRHFTHSLLFIPVGGLICSLVLHPLLGKRWHLSYWQTLLWCVIGFATHGLLDGCTSYGTQLLWPLTDQRFAWDIISIIDPLVTLPLLLAIVLASRRKSRRYVYIGLLWLCTYFSLAFVQHERAIEFGQQQAEARGHEVLQLEAKPSFGNILVWKVIYRTPDTYYVDAVTAGLSGMVYWPGESVAKLDLERDFPWLDKDSQQVKDIERFRWFSGGYLAQDAVNPNRIVDIRYSMLPQEIKPLWGIELSPDAKPTDHVEYYAERDDAGGAIKQLWTMLFAVPSKTE